MGKASSVEALIERQARLWDLGRRLAREGGTSAVKALAHLPEGPWISISRQLGSEGGEVASRLSESLDWQVYDREILAAIAEQTHTKEKIISRLDEHAVGRFNDFVNQLLVPDDMGQAGFLVELTRVCWAIARQGRAILLGRGANWFLDPRFGLRVRVIAPAPQRIRRIADRLGVPRAEAERQMRRHDAEQQAFIRQAFGRRIDDPHGYDLVLNSGHVTPEAGAETVLTALRRKLEAQA